MKIAFDTNVILDAIANRVGFKEAQDLIMAVATDKIQGVIAASSITDIYYIARKQIGDEAARAAIWNLLTVFDIAGVDGEDCASALSVPMSDYEDALLAVCAKRAEADYIATRDEGFIAANSPVSAKSPKELLELIE